MPRKPVPGRNVNDSDADLYAEYHGAGGVGGNGKSGAGGRNGLYAYTAPGIPGNSLASTPPDASALQRGGSTSCRNSLITGTPPEISFQQPAGAFPETMTSSSPQISPMLPLTPSPRGTSHPGSPTSVFSASPPGVTVPAAASPGTAASSPFSHHPNTQQNHVQRHYPSSPTASPGGASVISPESIMRHSVSMDSIQSLHHHHHHGQIPGAPGARVPLAHAPVTSPQPHSVSPQPVWQHTPPDSTGAGYPTGTVTSPPGHVGYGAPPQYAPLHRHMSLDSAPAPAHAQPCAPSRPAHQRHTRNRSADWDLLMDQVPDLSPTIETDFSALQAARGPGATRGQEPLRSPSSTAPSQAAGEP